VLFRSTFHTMSAQEWVHQLRPSTTLTSTAAAMMTGPTIPRSIRWRMQLGILQYPPNNNNEWTMEELSSYNETKVLQQRRTFSELRHTYCDELDMTSNVDRTTDTTNGEKELTPNEDNAASNDDIDPLTQMVLDMERKEQRLQQLEVKYRKERALRNRGVTLEPKIVLDDEEDGGDRFDTYSSTHTLGVIEKDLLRLPPDHHTYHHSRNNYQSQGGVEISFDESKQERTKLLTELLHIYSREHIAIGYRQGMHEIASYLVLTLEMDLFDQESAVENYEPTTGGLLDSEYIAADAYYMLQTILAALQGAYDVKQHLMDKTSPMEQMAHSILSKVRDTACDKPLYDHITTKMNCPPELYCTRWVRLLFSREVEGWRNVLLLWDILLDLISVDGSISSMTPSKYTRPGVSPPLVLGNFPLMQVLEAAAASMILLQRSKLLNATDPNESIHILMNVPPLSNILPLTATLLSIMRRIQLKDTIRDDQFSPLQEAPPKTSIFQSAQNVIRDLGGPGPGGALRRSLKAETVSMPRDFSVALPTFEDSWRGSLRNMLSSGDIRTASTVVMDNKNHHENKDALSRSEMATTLHQGVITIQTYLATLEKVTATNSHHDSAATRTVVPPAVWAALEEIDKVRGDLLAEPS